MAAPQQLPLCFDWSRLPRLAACALNLEPASLDAVAALTQTLRGVVLVWGAGAVGKTHVLRAAGAVVAEQGGRADYYSARDASALTGLMEGANEARPNFLAIDELDQITGEPAVEEALFRLFLRAEEGELALLLASGQHPERSGICLPDLRSRLLASECFRIPAPSDACKRRLVARHASERGLELTAEVLDFLFNRLPRDLHSLCGFVDRLDRLSLARHSGVSLKLARELIETDAVA